MGSLSICKSAEEGKKRIQEMAMQKKVRNFMKEYHMVEEGDCVLVAVSGGADRSEERPCRERVCMFV